MQNIRQLSPLYFVIFFGYLGYSLFITVFTPLFLSHTSEMFSHSTSQNVKILLLGFTLFLYPFGQFLSSPILGALSDRFGRKVILLISVLISVLIYSLIGISIWINNLYLLMSCLFIAGLSEGNLTIAQSAIADISTKQERGKLFGLIYVSTSCSYLIGPLLGGKLANPSEFYLYSYQTPFFVVSGLLFCMFFWLSFSFEETLLMHNREHVSVVNAFTNAKNAFLSKKFRFLFMVNFILYLSIFGFLQTFPIYILDKFDLGIGKLSLFIAWTSVPFLIANLWIIGYLIKRFGPLMTTLVSAIFIGIFLEILLVPQNVNALWITLFLVGCAVAICLPASSILISIFAKANEQGRILGVNQSLQFLAEAIACLLIGLLASIFIKLSLIFFGILAILGAILLSFYIMKVSDSSH